MNSTIAPKKKADRPSDAAVERATGRDWNDWFRRLDRAGSARLDHTTIARRLGEKSPELSPWWRQMITVQGLLANGIGALESAAGRVIRPPG